NLADEREAYGATIHKDRVICLDVNSSPSHMRQVLTHEVLHALLGMNDVHGLDGEQEEQVVRALTVGLHYVLRNNEPWWDEPPPDDSEENPASNVSCNLAGCGCDGTALGHYTVLH